MAARPSVCITNSAFSLHYRYTVFFLVLCSALVVLEVCWSGRPIACGSTTPIDEAFVSSCWRFGLWSTESPNKGLDFGHPGQPNTGWNFGAYIQLPNTYHYSFIFMLVQAVFFYVPYYFWYRYDNQLLAGMINEMKRPTNANTEEEAKWAIAAQSFSAKCKTREKYFFVYAFYQFLNFINVVAQVGFISYLYNINYLTYGVYAWGTWSAEKVSTTSLGFPLYGYCQMPDFGGPPGHNIGHCVLSVNSVNERVYFFYWIWMVVLFVTSTLELMWNFMLACGSDACRWRCFRLTYRVQYGKCMGGNTEMLGNNLNAGDYFLLSRIAQNLEESDFSKLLEGIGSYFREQVRNKYRNPVVVPDYDLNEAYPVDVEQPDRQRQESEYVDSPAK